MLASGFKCNSCYLVLTPKACKFSEMQLSPHQISEVSDQPPSSFWGSTHIFRQGALIGLPTLISYFLCLPLPLSFSSPSLPSSVSLLFPPFPPLSSSSSIHQYTSSCIHQIGVSVSSIEIFRCPTLRTPRLCENRKVTLYTFFSPLDIPPFLFYGRLL